MIFLITFSFLFSSLPYCKNTVYTYNIKICVNVCYRYGFCTTVGYGWLSSGGVKSYTQTFNYMGVGTPTPTWFKVQLYLDVQLLQ